MIGEAGYQDFFDYREAELKAQDLQPGMVVAGINVESAASEFDMDTTYYTAYPALVLDTRNNGTTTIQRLDGRFTPQDGVSSRGGVRFEHQLPYQWTEFYDLGVTVSISPMSERTARFVLDNVAPESKLDLSAHLYSEKGLVVAKQFAVTALAEHTLQRIYGLGKPSSHKPAAA